MEALIWVTTLFFFFVSRWRFAEFQYLQPGPSRQLQTVVVYLPDVWTIMPTLEEWEALCQQKAAEAAAPAQEVPVVRLSLMSKLECGCPEPWAQLVIALTFVTGNRAYRSGQCIRTGSRDF